VILNNNPDLFFKTHDVTRHMNVSKGLKDLLVKMLAIKPSQRLRIAEIVAKDEWVNMGPNS